MSRLISHNRRPAASVPNVQGLEVLEPRRLLSATVELETLPFDDDLVTRPQIFGNLGASFVTEDGDLIANMVAKYSADGFFNAGFGWTPDKNQVRRAVTISPTGGISVGDPSLGELFAVLPSGAIVREYVEPVPRDAFDNWDFSNATVRQLAYFPPGQTVASSFLIFDDEQIRIDNSPFMLSDVEQWSGALGSSQYLPTTVAPGPDGTFYAHYWTTTGRALVRWAGGLDADVNHSSHEDLQNTYEIRVLDDGDVLYLNGRSTVIASPDLSEIERIVPPAFASNTKVFASRSGEVVILNGVINDDDAALLGTLGSPHSAGWYAGVRGEVGDWVFRKIDNSAESGIDSLVAGLIHNGPTDLGPDGRFALHGYRGLERQVQLLSGAVETDSPTITLEIVQLEVSVGETYPGLSGRIESMLMVHLAVPESGESTYFLLATPDERAFLKVSVDLAQRSYAPDVSIDDTGEPVLVSIEDSQLVIRERGQSGGWVEARIGQEVWNGGTVLGDPKFIDNSLLFLPTTQGLYSIKLVAGTWAASRVTVEVIGPELTAFRDSRGIWIAGLNEGGELVAFVSRDRSQWTRATIAEDLAAVGKATPAFAGAITNYVTRWDQATIVGLDDQGRIQAVWFNRQRQAWDLSNLSEITGAPIFTGQITTFLPRTWSAINIAGVDDSGNLVAVWWVPSFGGTWQLYNYTESLNGPRISALSTVSYVYPWGGLNVGGVDASGNVSMYWWSPGLQRDTGDGSWRTATLPNPRDETYLGRASASSSRAGVSLLLTNLDGELLRLYWSPDSSWQQELIPVN